MTSYADIYVDCGMTNLWVMFDCGVHVLKMDIDLLVKAFAGIIARVGGSELISMYKKYHEMGLQHFCNHMDVFSLWQISQMT